jgi:hypothetical protein
MPEEGTVQNLDNPQCQTEEVKCLSAFVARVRAIREEWGIDNTKNYGFAAKARNMKNPFFVQLFIVPKRSPTR